MSIIRYFNYMARDVSTLSPEKQAAWKAMQSDQGCLRLVRNDGLADGPKLVVANYDGVPVPTFFRSESPTTRPNQLQYTFWMGNESLLYCAMWIIPYRSYDVEEEESTGLVPKPFWRTVVGSEAFKCLIKCDGIYTDKEFRARLRSPPVNEAAAIA